MQALCTDPLSEKVRVAATHPLCVLVCTDQELHDAGQCTMFPQRRVVGRAESQVTHQTNDGLDERPAAGWVQQFHQDRQAIVQAHSILGHLRLGVTRCQMAQGTHLQQQGSHGLLLNNATAKYIQERNWHWGM